MRARRPRSVTATSTALVALLLLPAALGAQWRRDRDRDRDRSRERYYGRESEVAYRDLTFLVGALRSDEDGQNFPMAAMRVNWRLRRWLRTELGASYGVGSRDILASNGQRLDDARVQLGTATLGLQAQLPLEYVRPYVGVAAGLFGRHEEGGDKFVRTTMAFPAGLRVMLSPRLALQGEVRWRFDQQERAGQAANIEKTGGISVAF